MYRIALVGVLGLAAAAPLQVALADGIPTTPRPRPRVVREEPPPPPPPQAPPVMTTPAPPPPAPSPWYAIFSAGAAFPQDTDFGAGPFSGSINYGTGFHAMLGGGYRFNPWIAAELELGYLHLPVDGASLAGVPISIDGTVHGFALFGNVVLTWPNWSFIQPYIAGGPGFVHRFSSDFSGVVAGVPVSGDIGSSTDFAVQAKAGIGFRLSERTTVGPEYRYIWVNTSGDGLRNTHIHAVGARLKISF